eukprot:gene4340-7696_t
MKEKKEKVKKEKSEKKIKKEKKKEEKSEKTILEEETEKPKGIVLVAPITKKNKRKNVPDKKEPETKKQKSEETMNIDKLNQQVQKMKKQLAIFEEQLKLYQKEEEEKDVTSKSIIVYNVATSVVEKDVREFFRGCGKIVVAFPMKKIVNDSRVWTVKFGSNTEAKGALGLRGTDFKGKKISIIFNKKK